MIEIPENEIVWANNQHMFFVASAPENSDGHVNCSPKGGDCFLLDESHFYYADYTGSGIETVAHIKQNKRICIMFCSFDKVPKILRFHGQGSYISREDSEFNILKKKIPYHRSIRAFIKVKIERYQKSCGYGVPIMEFKKDRETLLKWADSKSDDELITYQVDNNTKSIDGLSGI